MAFHPTPLERAFALARTGEYSGVAEIRAQLRLEGYALNQLEGPTLLKQLRSLCEAARQASEAERPSVAAGPLSDKGQRPDPIADPSY